jgi:hypothetical protein
MPIKFKCVQMNLRNKSVRATWKPAKKRSFRLRPSWCRSNKTKWTRLRKSLRPAWTSVLSWERLNTTRFCKDIRTSRRRSKANRPSRRTSRSVNTTLAQALRQAAAWWRASRRCKHPGWAKLHQMEHASEERELSYSLTSSGKTALEITRDKVAHTQTIGSICNGRAQV